jgi:hypothetical protein
MRKYKKPTPNQEFRARNFERLIARKKPLTYWKFLRLKTKEALQAKRESFSSANENHSH